MHVNKSLHVSENKYFEKTKGHKKTKRLSGGGTFSFFQWSGNHFLESDS